MNKRSCPTSVGVGVVTFEHPVSYMVAEEVHCGELGYCRRTSSWCSAVLCSDCTTTSSCSRAVLWSTCKTTTSWCSAVKSGAQAFYRDTRSWCSTVDLIVLTGLYCGAVSEVTGVFVNLNLTFSLQWFNAAEHVCGVWYYIFGDFAGVSRRRDPEHEHQAHCH